MRGESDERSPTVKGFATDTCMPLRGETPLTRENAASQRFAGGLAFERLADPPFYRCTFFNF
jgi:hypothetical protein